MEIKGRVWGVKMFIHFHNFEGMISDTVQRGVGKERAFNKILNTENTRWKTWLYLAAIIWGRIRRDLSSGTLPYCGDAAFLLCSLLYLPCIDGLIYCYDR